MNVSRNVQETARLKKKGGETKLIERLIMCEIVCSDVNLLPHVTRGSATQCCHPNLAEPPVKRQTDRLADRASSTSIFFCCHSLPQVLQLPLCALPSADRARGLKSGVPPSEAEHLHVAENCLHSFA